MGRNFRRGLLGFPAFSPIVSGVSNADRRSFLKPKLRFVGKDRYAVRVVSVRYRHVPHWVFINFVKTMFVRFYKMFFFHKNEELIS